VTSVASDTHLQDRYQLVSRLAVGGMGEVWQATDHVLGRQVAIKVVKPQLTDDPHFLERFRREARHTAKLTHPGIAQVYDYAEEQGRAYLVMELVPGEPLSALLNRAGRLDVDQTLDIIAQTALALQAAHDAGVVHRDVKPGNVLVTPRGTVKITDFGISRAADGTSLTQTGRVMGTAQYLSPEQAAGQSATPASDIYALGVVAYECLAGRRPFLGKNHVRLAEAHLQEEPPPLPDYVPARVRAVVDRLLAKDPADRPESAARLSEELTRLRGAGPGRRDPRTGPEPATAATAALPPPTRDRGRDWDRAGDPGADWVGERDWQPDRDDEAPDLGREPGRDSGRDSGRAAHRRKATHRSRRSGVSAGVIVVVVSLVLALVLGGIWVVHRVTAAGPPDPKPSTRQDQAAQHAAPASARGLRSAPAAIRACRFVGQQYTAARRALTAQNVDVELQTKPGPGVPGTVSSVAPCTAQEGRAVTLTVVSVPHDDKPGKGKGKGKK
jgi:serine/threonine protein kinase